MPKHRHQAPWMRKRERGREKPTVHTFDSNALWKRIQLRASDAALCLLVLFLVPNDLIYFAKRERERVNMENVCENVSIPFQLSKLNISVFVRIFAVYCCSTRWFLATFVVVVCAFLDVNYNAMLSCWVAIFVARLLWISKWHNNVDWLYVNRAANRPVLIEKKKSSFSFVPESLPESINANFN